MTWMPPIYLDHNATTPLLPEVVEAMRACYAEPLPEPRQPARIWPPGPPPLGRRPRADRRAGGRENHRPRRRHQSLHQRRHRIQQPRRAGPSRSASRGDASPRAAPDRYHLRLEHPSITALADELARSGHQIDQLPVDRNGVLQVDALPALLRPETRLVTAMLGQQRNRRPATRRRNRRPLQRAQHPAPHRRHPSRRQTPRRLPRPRRRDDDLRRPQVPRPARHRRTHRPTRRRARAATLRRLPTSRPPPGHRIGRARRRHAHRARTAGTPNSDARRARLHRAPRPISNSTILARLARSRRDRRRRTASSATRRTSPSSASIGRRCSSHSTRPASPARPAPHAPAAPANPRRRTSRWASTRP